MVQAVSHIFDQIADPSMDNAPCLRGTWHCRVQHTSTLDLQLVVTCYQIQVLRNRSVELTHVYEIGCSGSRTDIRAMDSVFNVSGNRLGWILYAEIPQIILPFDDTAQKHAGSICLGTEVHHQHILIRMGSGVLTRDLECEIALSNAAFVVPNCIDCHCQLPCESSLMSL